MGTGKHGKPWSNDEDRSLIDQATKGRTSREAAVVIGRSHEACRKRAKVLGIPMISAPVGRRSNGFSDEENTAAELSRQASSCDGLLAALAANETRPANKLLREGVQRSYHPTPNGSGMGSPAAMCSENKPDRNGQFSTLPTFPTVKTGAIFR